MAKISHLMTLALTAILLSSVNAMAQTAGGTAGAPAAGAAGAGTAATSGIAPGPANPGGLNNTLNDPSGQGNASKVAPPQSGTNSAGTANSSGGSVSGNSSGAVTTGNSGTRATGGVGVTGPNTTGDAAIDAEDKAVDKKIKSICKGC